jgi:hypothetical protein
MGYACFEGNWFVSLYLLGEEVDRKVGDEQALGPDQKVGTTCSSKTNNRLESGGKGGDL